MTGTGRMTYEDGSRYIGEFQDGKRHGEGVYQDIEGNQYGGVFEDDAMIERNA